MSNVQIYSSMADAGPQWDLRRRGLKDSLRHDQRVKEAIRQNLRDIITEEAIITSDGHKRVKIPVRYMEQYRFKYGQPQRGTGQGEGKPGDVLGRRGGKGDGQGDGLAGDQPGEEMYEAEVDLKELTEMALKDLALPWLEEKPERQITSRSLQFTDIRKTGSLSRLAKILTLKKHLKRRAAQGDATVGKLLEPDLLFRTWDEHFEYHANAVVYMLMDRSGSMTTSKKYVAKSFFFWMVRFLRRKYEHVETVFIAHDTDAKAVPEKDFFALSNSGGTRCSSAYQTALDHMEQYHPVNKWNIYLFHFSDGDNLPYDNNVCKQIVEKLLGLCQMVGYGEIKYKDDASFYGWMGGASPLSSLQNKLNEIKHPRLVVATITHKEELHAVLQNFLKKPETTARAS